MDRQALAILIPVLVVSIPVIAIIFNGLQKLAKLRLEEARVRARPPEHAGDVDALRTEVEQLRHELLEVQERLDFTERMLARDAERTRLPQPPA
jgi:Tfp pilus assembly protein PilO